MSHRRKVLLMGKSGAGKTSMRSIIFSDYMARDTMRLSPTYRWYEAAQKKRSKHISSFNDESTGFAGQVQHAHPDILNSILPPREWTEDGHLWVQYVSSTPATRLDVVNLQEHLDHQLQSRQARETGICPVREELYNQCFDELIRQITINCQERGLLLLRCRDESRMTITAYETLYESAIAYGIRKALMAEHRRTELEAKVRQLNLSKKELSMQVESMKKTIDNTITKGIEKRDAEEKIHCDEVERIQRTNDQLKTTLESLLSAPKK